jgi:membrane protease YdiL (CAAX protease family)
MKMDAYLDLARQGKNNWWRFLLAVGLILFMWQIVGAIPSVVLLIWTQLDGNPHTGLSAAGLFQGVDIDVVFVTLMLASVFFLLGLYLAVRFIHGRTLRSLITPSASISWGRFFQAFGVWLGLSLFMSIVEALLHPGRYVWTFDVRHFIPFIFLALALIPIQSSTEELFFRGYIIQGMSLRSHNIWLLSAVSGFLFMVPHLLNPEAQTNYLLLGLDYFCMGAAMAYISLKDGRLELALGLHTANNLFAALFVNSTVTVMPTPSLFTVNVLDPVYSVAAALIGLAVFILLFTGPFHRKEPVIASGG